MNKKILKSTSVVPTNLYVERDADRQIKNVLEDMGRPGYILVARQMGKTNLLLNTKRKFENENNIYVYIDLTNLFTTSRECFRNIIDVAIETNLNKFESEYYEIIKDRNNLSLPPHKEHQRELKRLLNKITGKMVIILDEVDAIASCNYSDEIFSQIRTVYFNRVNFIESERLTYILSGVAEPSELIKNKDISPFNIGQKIYLYDFSYEEFINFIKIANLNFDEKVIEKIFFWCNGNPRISWDVCSEIEDSILLGNSIDESTVDDIVYKLYFENYKKAPIDHIREKIEDNREIRDAIIQIKYGKGSTLSDKIKNKLYLTGIIGSFSDRGEVHIKNRIVDNSLSLDWLESLDVKSRGILRVADEKFVDKNYEKAVELYEELLSEHEKDNFEKLVKNEKSYFFYKLGRSCFYSGLHSKSAQYLERTEYNKNKYPDLYFECLLAKASSYFHLKEYDKSEECFKEIISEERNDGCYFQALLGFGSFYLNRSKNNDIDNAEILFFKILNEIENYESEFEKNSFFEIKVSSFYSLSTINIFKKDLKTAKENLVKAIEISSNNNKPKLLYELFLIEDDADIKISLINESVRVITESELKPIINENLYILPFGFNVLSKILLECYKIDKDGLYVKLFDYMFNSCDTGISDKLDLSYHIAIFDINIGNGEIAKDILLDIESRSKNELIKPVNLFNVYKLLCSNYYNDLENPRHYFDKFFYYFTGEFRPEIIDVHDVLCFASEIFRRINNNIHDKIIIYIDNIYSYYEKSTDQMKSELLVINYFKMQYYEKLHKNDAAIFIAKLCIDQINYLESKNIVSTILGREGFNSIRDIASSSYDGVNKTKIVPIKKETKIGRNEWIKVKYKDGNIIEAKYKKLEKDIINGNCVIQEA